MSLPAENCSADWLKQQWRFNRDGFSSTNRTFFPVQTGSYRMVSEEEQAMRSKLEHLTVKDHGSVFGPCTKLPGHTVQKVKIKSALRHAEKPLDCLSCWCLFMCFPKAKDELNETEERRASSVKDLRAMIKERAAEGDDLAKLVQERFGNKPDSLLLRFLRARKFDISRSHELMKGPFPESNRFCNTFKFHFNVIRHKWAFISLDSVPMLQNMLQ